MSKTQNQPTHGSIYERFGRNVARARSAAGLSQSEAAARLDMPQSTYSGYESGTRKVPLSVILQISELYGVTPDELIGGSAAPAASFEISPLEKDIVTRFRSLPAGEKNFVLRSLGLPELSGEEKDGSIGQNAG